MCKNNLFARYEYFLLQKCQSNSIMSFSFIATRNDSLLLKTSHSLHFNAFLFRVLKNENNATPTFLLVH